MKLNVYYRHTRSPNGGFGVLGKGIYEGLKKSPYFNVKKFQDEGDNDVDIILTYGMPDLIDTIIQEYKGKKRPYWIHYMVWESSLLPDDFVKAYHKPDLMLTSTKFVQKVLKRGTKRIKGRDSVVWHHAIDDRFQYIERKDDGIFTFLHYNAYEYRKGWDVLLKAFTEEFYIDEPVRLLMKARERVQSVWLIGKKPPISNEEYKKLKNGEPSKLIHSIRGAPVWDVNQLPLEHPLIEEIIGHISDEEMVDMYTRADCFVFPAKGEGWGLPPCEAAATGITCIVPNKQSFKEWFDPESMIDVKLQGYLHSAPRYPGWLMQVSKNDLRKKLRWCFEHQDEIREMGKKASEHINRNYRWDRVMDDFYQIVKQNYRK